MWQCKKHGKPLGAYDMPECSGCKIGRHLNMADATPEEIKELVKWVEK